MFAFPYVMAPPPSDAPHGSSPPPPATLGFYAPTAAAYPSAPSTTPWSNPNRLGGPPVPPVPPFLLPPAGAGGSHKGADGGRGQQHEAGGVGNGASADGKKRGLVVLAVDGGDPEEGPGAGGKNGGSTGLSHWYKWLLVTLMSFEILTATGITFGWSALSLALRRDRVYFELCDDPSANGECDAVELQFGLIYAAGAISLPCGITIFGFVMDRYGAVVVRLIGCFFLVVGSVLFALSDSVRFDAYVAAIVLISGGGSAFFMSHFVIAEHFRHDHFGLVHALINSFFDASTITFTIFEILHRAGISIQSLFIFLACLCALFAILSSDYTCSYKKQLLIPHFWLACVWMLVTVFRTMYMLGTVRIQMVQNGGGKTPPQADDLVRVFNWLILVSAIITPLFGRLMDTFGIAAGFLFVNSLGVFVFGAIHSSNYGLLYFAFVVFGCFRAWNYGAVTAYCQSVFGGANFGRIYGLIGLWGVVASALQAPVIAISLQYLPEWGDFLPVNLTIEACSALVYAFPVFIWWQGRREPPSG